MGVSSVSQACFALLQSPAYFAEHPDLVEEYFYLASRFLDYCPGSPLSSPLLGHILQSASTGLRVEHREALRGVLHFCASARPPRCWLSRSRATPCRRRCLQMSRSNSGTR